MIELVEELLMQALPNFDREEIRDMFDLVGLRETRSWQEAYEEGELGAKQKLVLKWLAKGMTAKEIAELLEISTREVRRLAKALPSKHKARRRALEPE